MASRRSTGTSRDKGEGVFACPVCGEEIHEGMLACPECGADDKSGWSEEAFFEPDFDSSEEFNYDKFLEDEFGTPRKRTGKERMSIFVAVLLVLAFLLWILNR